MTVRVASRRSERRRPEGHPVLRALVAVQLRLAGIGVLAVALLFAVVPFAQPGVRAAGPRVAIIVGPVGSLTAAYRADAEKAAAAARRYTDDVVTIYSPNATWGAARSAMQGASIVVYLGHGNGFPSPYGRSLKPRVQDGLGLNAVAGGDDIAHQYFGEAYLAAQVRLAPNAVVVLSHLCYASGNSEPGVAEGSLDTARQRVDNFAAGFLAAGAGAVIADGHLGPAYYVRSVLSGKGTVEGIWRKAPNYHDHVVAFTSTRSPGLTALMDPTLAGSQFYRSLVTRADLRASEVARGAGRRVAPAAPVPGGGTAPGGWEVVAQPESSVAPDAFALGARPGTPALAGMPLAAATLSLRLPVEVPAGVALGAAYRLGTRWIPLDEADAPVEPAGAGDPPGNPADDVSPGPGVVPADAASADPAGAGDAPAASRAPDPGKVADPGPDPAAAAGAPDGWGLVARESAAALVEVVPASVAGGDVAGIVTLPAASGRYRLEVTLHDADGVALPYAVQAAIPGVVVHVGGPGAAWLDAPPSLAVAAGTLTSLQVVTTNGEPIAWGGCGRLAPSSGTGAAACPDVRLVGRWVALAGAGTAAPMTRSLAVPAAAARATWLAGPVPTEPGTYLLVLSLERTTGDGPTEVLGRPVTVTVVVAAAPLLRPASGDVADPPLPPASGPDLVPLPGPTPNPSAGPSTRQARPSSIPSPAPLPGPGTRGPD